MIIGVYMLKETEWFGFTGQTLSVRDVMFEF